MLGTFAVSGVCPMGTTGRTRRNPVLREKGAEDNSEEDDPIPVGYVTDQADPKAL